MANSDALSDRLREPLNETTRKARRNLLLASIGAFLVAKVELVPQKISALGVDFGASNQEALVQLLLLVITYFAIAFVVYVVSEISAWRFLLASEKVEQIKKNRTTQIRRE